MVCISNNNNYHFFPNNNNYHYFESLSCNHLTLDISGELGANKGEGLKPAIAHRDFKSKNVFIKVNILIIEANTNSKSHIARELVPPVF